MHYIFSLLICMICLSVPVSVFHIHDSSSLRMAVSHITQTYTNPIPMAAETIKAHEGFSSRPYMDITGYAIGYGTHSKHYVCKGHITRAQAHKLLCLRLQGIAHRLDKRISWWRSLSTERQSAMLNLAYNVGIKGLFKFKQFVQAMKDGDMQTASFALLYRDAFKKKVKTPYWRITGDRAMDVALSISGHSTPVQLLSMK